MCLHRHGIVGSFSSNSYYMQRENKKENKDQVVIVLLNMLEVVTKDIMDDTVER